MEKNVNNNLAYFILTTCPLEDGVTCWTQFVWPVEYPLCDLLNIVCVTCWTHFVWPVEHHLCDLLNTLCVTCWTPSPPFSSETLRGVPTGWSTIAVSHFALWLTWAEWGSYLSFLIKKVKIACPALRQVRSEQSIEEASYLLFPLPSPLFLKEIMRKMLSHPTHTFFNFEITVIDIDKYLKYYCTPPTPG